MVSYGKQGYRDRARRIFDTSFEMQDVVTSHPELRLHGQAHLLLLVHLG